MNEIETLKKRLGEESAKLVQPHTRVGIGTGSTVFWFIESLAKRCKEGLAIQAVATSKTSSLLAQSKGIPLLQGEEVSHVDLTVDGADFITEKKEMIKGGGGALLREKIIASLSTQIYIIVDETKLVSSLHGRKLPVEILPFGHIAAIQKIEALGFQGHLRQTEAEKPYVTDNGNYIFDIDKNTPSCSLEKAQELLYQIPGVIETGFFANLPAKILIGYRNGEIKIVS